jgi:hypothetical protein
MTDPRISQYREAAKAMKTGDFRVEIPISEEDDIGLLGKELISLGQTLENKWNEIKLLSHITDKINAGLLLDEILDHIYDTFRPFIPYNRLGLCLLEKNNTIVRACWARTDSPAPQITKGYEMPIEGSSLKKILETGTPRIINDLEEYLRDHPNSECTKKILKEGVKSNLACPLIATGKPIGFLFFSSFEKNTYKNIHVELFSQITGQVAMSVEKGRLYQDLVELNKMMDKFLGVASHDLRNPITVISSYARILSHGMLGPLNESQQETIQKIRQNCDNMLLLVNDLVDISAIESGQLVLKPQEVDPAKFLKECYDDNQILAREKDIDLVLDLESDLPTVLLDPERIIQVLNNLVNNGIKFSNPGTCISIKALRAGDNVEISVKDQGQGIPEDELPMIFTAFGQTTVKPTAGEKSTGLGLVICKRNVEAHGGSIWAESQVGKGSTFTFSLPIRNPSLLVIIPKNKYPNPA